MSNILNQLAGQWVGILIGIACSFLFWWITRQKRILFYSVNPITTRIVRAGQISDLKVLYKDETFNDKDITAVQIAWARN
jgi:hypothetical protein